MGSYSTSETRKSRSMEVQNACGRKVSLLNDESSVYPSYPRPNKHSRKSSYSTQASRDDSDSSQISRLTSPTFSPRSAPQLVRYNSTSSQGTLQTPSPMTPDYGFELVEQNKQSSPQNPYYRANGPYYAAMHYPQDPASQPYYGIPFNQGSDYNVEDVYTPFGEPEMQAQYSYPAPDLTAPVLPQSSVQTPTPALPASGASASPTNSKGTTQTVKKKYPCPHAKLYGCSDTFTTSGHAARHGKKHTGEKNIYCPTCNKAFTRKDNMKQHERTHKNSQDVSGNTRTPFTSKSPGLVDSESRENHNASRTRIKAARSRSTAIGPKSLSNESTLESDEMDTEDGQTVYDVTSPVQHVRSLTRRYDVTGRLDSNLSINTTLADEFRPGFDRKISGESQDGEGESPGLDALAIAASGIKQEDNY